MTEDTGGDPEYWQQYPADSTTLCTAALTEVTGPASVSRELTTPTNTYSKDFCGFNPLRLDCSHATIKLKHWDFKFVLQLIRKHLHLSMLTI